MPEPLWWRGTILPNAHTVYIIPTEGDGVEEVRAAGGVFMWPNGWITVYPTTNQNEGLMYPPHKVARIDFSKAPESPPGRQTEILRLPQKEPSR